MDDLLLCLECYRDLVDQPLELNGPDGLQRRCRCGVRYSQQLLDTIDIDTWTKVVRRDNCRVVKDQHGDLLVLIFMEGR